MAVQLILLRHGIARDRDPEGDDFERPLTPEGIRFLEHTLRSMKPRIRPSREQIILASPRIRAVQTAEIAAAIFGIGPVRIEPFVDQGLFGDLADFLEKYDDNRNRTVWVVGHQPTLGYWSGMLCGRRQPFRKGGAASFTIPGKDIRQASLDWVMPPKEKEQLPTEDVIHVREEDISKLLSTLFLSLSGALTAYRDDPDDPEAAHRIRTAARKLSAATRLYSPILRDFACKDILRIAKMTGKRFAALRDADVLIGTYQRFCASEDPAAAVGDETQNADGHRSADVTADPLRDLIRLRRKAEQNKIRHADPTDAVRQKIVSYASEKTIAETFFRRNSGGRMPFLETAKMEKMREKLADCLRTADALNMKDVHAFRIAARQLRYVCEFMGEDPEKVRFGGMGLRKIQDILGGFLDARRGLSLLPEFEDKAEDMSAQRLCRFREFLRKEEERGKAETAAVFGLAPTTRSE